MSNPSKMSPANARKVRTLVEAGKSDLAIARALGVTDKTISKWRKQLHLAPSPAAKSKKGKLAPTKAERELAAEIVEAEQLTKDVDHADPYAVAKAALERCTRATSRFYGAFLKGEMSPTVYQTLVRMQREAAQDVVALAPPAEPDPTSDPTTQELAAQTVAKLRQLIAAEHARKEGRT